MKFSLYFFVAVMSLLLTACSSNHVKPENNQLLSNSKTNQQIVKNAKIKKKKVSEFKPKPVLKVSNVKTIKQPRRYVRKKTIQRRASSNYKRRNLVNNRKKYKPQRKNSYRKYVARKNNNRKYVARKNNYRTYVARKKSNYRRPYIRRITPRYPPIRRNNSFAKALSNAAVARTRQRVRYDGRYVNIKYPWGDVPSNIGVCTDVVIRSYRRLGIDLQKEVHEDMVNGGFYDYPNIKKWGLSAPDKNIDHRRVYNLQAFFRRHGAQLPITHNPTDYKPGDLVTWMVGPSLPHIGVVVEQRSKADPRRHMIVHNIANGPEMEDVLFRFRITGHYRYTKNNRLIAPRRYATNNNIGANYQRLMRELSVAPARRYTRNRRPQNIPRRINIAQSGISDADIRAVLGR